MSQESRWLDVPTDTRDFNFDLHIAPVVGNGAFAIRPPEQRELPAMTQLRRQPEHPRHVVHAVAMEGFAEGEDFQRVEEVVRALRPAFPEREDLFFIEREIILRINQIEQAGLQHGIKTKVRRAASRARRRVKTKNKNDS